MRSSTCLGVVLVVAAGCGGQVLLGERNVPGGGGGSSGANGSGGSSGASGSSGSGAAGAIGATGALGCSPTIEVLTTSCSSTTQLAVDGTNVFYTAVDCTPQLTGPKLLSLPRGGGTPTPLVTDYYYQPYGQFTMDDQDIFYTTGASLFAMPKGGGPARTLAALDPYLGSLVVDRNGLVFSTDTSILRIPKAGGDTTQIVDEGAHGIVVDASNVYWVALETVPPMSTFVLKSHPKTGGHKSILAADIDFGDHENAAAGYAETQSRFGADDDNLYWGNRRDQKIMKYPKAGGAPTVLAEGMEEADWIISLTVWNGWVAWIEGSMPATRRLFAVPVSGGTPLLVATLHDSAYVLAADASGFYYTTAYATPGAVMHLSCTWK